MKKAPTIRPLSGGTQDEICEEPVNSFTSPVAALSRIRPSKLSSPVVIPNITTPTTEDLPTLQLAGQGSHKREKGVMGYDHSKFEGSNSFDNPIKGHDLSTLTDSRNYAAVIPSTTPK